MRIYILFIMVVGLPFFLGCASSLPERYVSLQDGSVLTIDEVLPAVENEKVILIGESHESMQDHMLQLELIKRLHERGTRVAVALEMFPAEKQTVLNQWISGAISEDDFEKAYRGAWRVPYRYYSGIFEYAKHAGIPLVGINVNKAQMDDIARQGVGALPGDFRKTILLTSCAEEPEYEKMINFIGARAGHPAALPFLCDAQLFRDTFMAYNIRGVLDRGGFTVVALVGDVHAMRIAVPRILSRHYGVGSKILMSGAFTELLFKEPDAAIADFVWH